MKMMVGYLVAMAPLAVASPCDSPPNKFPGRPARTYADCQRLNKPNPLDGCPPGTLHVSAGKQDSYNTANVFTTIQSAIASLPHDDSPHTILITPGTYTEQLNITRPGALTLLGQSDSPLQGTPYAAIADDTTHQNLVQVIWSSANNDSSGKIQDNAFTSVLTIAPTYNASLTGTGPTGFPVPASTPFGSRDFRAYNIDFRNVFSTYSAGPALALSMGYANAGFYSCGFYSYQDTVYIGKLGNAYFYDGVVAGQTDFFYGFGTCWVEKSSVVMRGCGGGLTAWKGTNTTFENRYGVYVSGSRVIGSNETVRTESKGKCALGRPWNSLHRSIFSESYLDETVLPAGYVIWQPTDPRSGPQTMMAVSKDFGPGWDEAALRAGNVTKVLDEAGERPYRAPVDVFIGPQGEKGNVGWIDQSVLKR